MKTWGNIFTICLFAGVLLIGVSPFYLKPDDIPSSGIVKADSIQIVLNKVRLPNAGLDTISSADLDTIYFANNTLYDSLANYITLKNETFAKDNLLFWSRLFLLFFSMFAALAFWWIASYVNQQFNSNQQSGIKIETGETPDKASYIWLTTAMLLWVLRNIVWLYVKNIYRGEDLKWCDEQLSILGTVNSVTSTINSMCILSALTYLEIDFSYSKVQLRRLWQNIHKNPQRWRLWIIVGSFTVISADLIVAYMFSGEGDKDSKIQFLFDLLYSFFTCLLLATGMSNVFRIRELPGLSWLAQGTAWTAFLAQLINILDLFFKKDSLILYAAQMTLSMTFVAFLVTMLFSLELSWLGWKKQGILKSINNLLKTEQEDLERTQKDLITESQVSQGFFSIISRYLDKSSTEKIVSSVMEELKRAGIFDYFFGIAILNKKNDEIVFPYYYYKDAVPAKYFTSPPQGTFAAFCITKGEDVVVGDLEDQAQRAKYQVKDRNKGIAPDAASLLMLPLKRGREDATVFGALSLQSTVKDRIYSVEESATLRAYARLLGKLIDPDEALLSPEIHFIRCVGKEGDKPFHFDPNTKKTKIRPIPYNYLDDFMGWSAPDTDTRFHLLHNGYYLEGHPINRTLKGIAQSKISNGSILLIATASFERRKHDLALKVDNPFLTHWNNLIKQWKSEPEASHYDDFFRHERLSGVKKEFFRQKVNTLFELFSGLVVKEVDGAEATGSNVSHIETNIEKGMLHIYFGINDMQKFREKIEFNIAQFGEHGKQGLRYSITGPIVYLELYLFPGKVRHETQENTVELIFQCNL